jgi:hypothetical protein
LDRQRHGIAANRNRRRDRYERPECKATSKARGDLRQHGRSDWFGIVLKGNKRNAAVNDAKLRYGNSLPGIIS